MYHTGKVKQNEQTVFYTVISGYAIELFICEEIDLTINGWSDDISEMPAGVRAGVLRWCQRVWTLVVEELEIGEAVYAEPYDDYWQSARIKWLKYLGFKEINNGEFIFTKDD